MTHGNDAESPETGDRLQRREFVTRHVLGIGAVAATALLARVDRAAAYCHEFQRGDDCEHNCFLRGTRILTVDGERKIEDLAAGDLLPTVFGGARPILWIDSFSYKKRSGDKAWAKYARPVRIAKHALGDNAPHADLLVTPGHALLIDGVLAPAGALINGTTITLDPAEESDELEYFHIKVEGHDVIFAEGAPCETLLHIDEKADNYAEYARRHGAPATNEIPCAPHHGGGRKEILSHFRNAISPWLDRREPYDFIRDRLAERGAAPQGEPVAS